MTRFRIALSVLPFALGLALLAGNPAETLAQLRCAWCVQHRSILSPDSAWFHGFASDDPKDNCQTAVLIGVDPGRVYLTQCSGCGGTSRCHTDEGWDDVTHPNHRWTVGECHAACTPSDLAEAVEGVQQGLETRNFDFMATQILTQWKGFSVEYVPAAGRIDFVAERDPTRSARTIALPPAMRRALDLHLGARAAAATP